MPLLSCKTEKSKDHGVEGFFDPIDYPIYENCLIITSDGANAGTASYHNHKFIAKDNVLVCVPKENTDLSTILYAVSYINSQKWRFSYGRKCYENKINKITIDFPVKGDEIDHEFLSKTLNCDIKSIFPQGNKTKELGKINVNFKELEITELFEPLRGDFHSLTELSKGTMPTVSRTSLDNGIAGMYEPPDNAKIYPSGYLTVSTVSGEVFLQVDKFMATDNILILEPKRKLKSTTIVFIQTILNSQKWRYSYGRQCYRTKFLQSKLFLPTLNNGNLDEDIMEKIVKNTTYWNYVMPHVPSI